MRAELVNLPPDGAPGILQDVRLDGHKLTATVDSDNLTEAMRALTALGLTSLTVEPQSLETVFLSLYQDVEPEAAH